MAYYKDDREFTNIVHNDIALPEIYAQLGWYVDKSIDAEKLNDIDMNDGIDYVMYNRFGKTIYVQERFREYRYHSFNDATLRYRREHNINTERQRSEFYKIKADYLVYGIISGSKRQVLTGEKQCTFVKYAVIDLRVLFDKISRGMIVPDPRFTKPRIIGDVMYAAVNENTDYSSNFVAFDVEGLERMFGNDGIILIQNGFF